MSFARPIRIPSKPVSSFHSKKNAIEAALRQISQEARLTETSRRTPFKPTSEKPTPCPKKSPGHIL
jgi:hypothetical protein